MEQILRSRRLLTVVLLMLVTLVSIPMAAQAAKGGSALTVPVTGATDAGGRFVGSLDIQRFATQGNQLVAVGTLTGTLTNADGTVVGNLVRTVALPVAPAAIQAACDILHLELGPLDLDLLGLVVHLDRVVLDITAQPGAGNLLGNLLCAVANLLNGNGALTAIANLLNQILAVLSGI